MTPTVALVIVSHSAGLAAGVVELASQMAPNVRFFACGGLPDGSLGTSLDSIEAALQEALAETESAIVLADLGSAVMTAEAAIEMLDQPSRVALVDAPVVEGAVAAAVAAQQGEDLQQVAKSARTAYPNPLVGDQEVATEEDDSSQGQMVREVTIADPQGLHARPAAKLAALVANYQSEILVDNADARSVLALMSLGKRQGETVTLTVTGPDAEKAILEVGDAIAAGFDD